MSSDESLFVTNSPIHLIYASTSGNTELVVEKVAEVWQSAGQTVELHRAERTSPDAIASNQLFVLATSTWEHGQLNPFFKKLFDALKNIDCSAKKAAFIGCGDMRYEPVLFCGGMETLRERWLTQHGQEAGERLKINGEPHVLLHTTVTSWAQTTLPLLQEQHD